jgi:hypothetical protein
MEGFSFRRSHRYGPDSEASLQGPAYTFPPFVNAGRPSRVQIMIEQNHCICSTSAPDVAFLTHGGL